MLGLQNLWSLPFLLLACLVSKIDSVLVSWRSRPEARSLGIRDGTQLNLQRRGVCYIELCLQECAITTTRQTPACICSSHVSPICAATPDAQPVESQGEPRLQLGLLWSGSWGNQDFSLVSARALVFSLDACLFIYLAKWIIFKKVLIFPLVFFSWMWRGNISPRYGKETYLSKPS